MTIVLEDIKKYAKIFKSFTLVFTTCYFIFVIFTKTGIFAINIALVLLFLTYSILNFVTWTNNPKRAKRVVRKSYKVIVLSIRLFTLASMVYGIYNATTDVSALSILFATLMIVFWVFQVFLELFIHILEEKIDIILAGWNKDVEDIKKPITNVKKVIKRIKGQPIPEEPKKSKELLRLEQKIKENEKNAQKKSQRKVTRPEKRLKTKTTVNKLDPKLLK